jgi:exosortase A-associated hydrolase 1
VTETALVFECRGEALAGVLHVSEATADLGIVIVVGGPQYRAGSHRQFVRLARAACRAGYAVLRFDVRGMGDSEGAPRSFDELHDDIAAGIDAMLAHAHSVRRVVLWGLCDGAAAAWLYVHASGDARVAGVCAVNPWVRSREGLARTHIRHYYAKRVMSRSFWSKVIGGGVGWSALRGLASAIKSALSPRQHESGGHGTDFRQRMAQGCARCPPGGVLLVLSGNDYTAKEFADHVARTPQWQAALRVCDARRCEVAGADHTLSHDADRLKVEQATVRWLDELRNFTTRTA